MLTINQLARQSGVASNVVRYYARIGLIRPSGRRDNGYRLFDRSENAGARPPACCNKPPRG